MELTKNTFVRNHFAKLSSKRRRELLMSAFYHLMLAILFACIFYYFTTEIVWATDDNDLLELLRDDYSTTGSLRFVQKYGSLITWITRAVVSMGGVILISFQVIQFAVTIAYLSYTPFFDYVHAVQTGQTAYGNFDGGVLGVSVGGQGQSVMDTVRNFSITNTIMFFVAKCLIDVRAFSDNEALEGEDGLPTPMEYARNSMFKFICLVILGYGLWKGQIQRIVANFAEGGYVIGEYIEGWNAGAKVRSIMEADRDYQFVYPKDDAGRNKTALAKKIYSTVKTAVPKDRTETYLQSIGKKIRDTVDKMSFDSTVVNGWYNNSLSFRVIYVKKDVTSVPVTIKTEGATTFDKNLIAKWDVSTIAKSNTVVSDSDYGWIIIQVSADNAVDKHTTDNKKK